MRKSAPCSRLRRATTRPACGLRTRRASSASTPTAPSPSTRASGYLPIRRRRRSSRVPCRSHAQSAAGPTRTTRAALRPAGWTRGPSRLRPRRCTTTPTAGAPTARSRASRRPAWVTRRSAVTPKRPMRRRRRLQRCHHNSRRCRHRSIASRLPRRPVQPPLPSCRRRQRWRRHRPRFPPRRRALPRAPPLSGGVPPRQRAARARTTFRSSAVGWAAARLGEGGSLARSRGPSRSRPRGTASSSCAAMTRRLRRSCAA